MTSAADPNKPVTGSPPSDAPAAPAAEAPRDAAYWARQATNLRASAAPLDQVNNVDGRSAMSPLQGFGKMWQKTYRIRMVGATVTPAEVISAWKAHFQSFWPRGNRFYAPLTGITPGEVAILRVRVGGMMPLSTGVLVLYADDESFTLMTPQGHMFAGWITFSAYEEDGCTVAQAQVLMRANDPLYELGLRLGGHHQENKFWRHTLQAVAAYFGVKNEPVQTTTVCIDPHVRWRSIGNIRHNAAIRTILLGPTRWFRRRPRQDRPPASPPATPGTPGPSNTPTT
jgi:hypothetical protein